MARKLSILFVRFSIILSSEAKCSIALAIDSSLVFPCKTSKIAFNSSKLNSSFSSCSFSSDESHKEN